MNIWEKFERLVSTWFLCSLAPSWFSFDFWRESFSYFSSTLLSLNLSVAYEIPDILFSFSLLYLKLSDISYISEGWRAISTFEFDLSFAEDMTCYRILGSGLSMLPLYAYGGIGLTNTCYLLTWLPCWIS